MEQTNTVLNEYLTEFTAIRNAVGDDRVASVILQEVAKDRRTQTIQNERQAKRGRNPAKGQATSNPGMTSEPASERQIDFLKDLGMPVPAGLTRQAASELIERGLEKRREQ